MKEYHEANKDKISTDAMSYSEEHDCYVITSDSLSKFKNNLAAYWNEIGYGQTERPINIHLLLLIVLCPLPNNNDRIGYH